MARQQPWWENLEWCWKSRTERKTGRRRAVSRRSSSEIDRYFWLTDWGEPCATPPADVKPRTLLERHPATGALEETSGSAERDSLKATGRCSRTSANESSGTTASTPSETAITRSRREDHRARLINNLVNTEIDIVLESPKRLYIGEAKYTGTFHANGKLVLVHQLVRQYVMAKVLVDVLGRDREIVPFVVVEESGRRPGPKDAAKEPAGWPHQARFMVKQGWMGEGSRLTWDALRRWTGSRRTCVPRECPSVTKWEPTCRQD